MKIIQNVCLLLAITLSTGAFCQEVRKINTCFEEALAPLRLSQLEDGVARCSEVIEGKAAVPQQRGEAYAQRGLMQARRWTVMATTAFATQGIADITEALKLHTPPQARKRLLWFVRARLYAATGQNRRASEDFNAILREDPGNADAHSGLARVQTEPGS